MATESVVGRLRTSTNTEHMNPRLLWVKSEDLRAVLDALEEAARVMPKVAKHVACRGACSKSEGVDQCGCYDYDEVVKTLALLRALGVGEGKGEVNVKPK
jgi:hypothetical protein